MRTTATLETLEAALASVNAKYANNVIWNRTPERKGKQYVFTLRVADSKEPGHRRGFAHPSWYGANGKPHKARRLTSACWHVHGEFFNAVWDIEPEAVIRAGALVMRNKADNWQDRNVGSLLCPQMFSEACDC